MFEIQYFDVNFMNSKFFQNAFQVKLMPNIRPFVFRKWFLGLPEILPEIFSCASRSKTISASKCVRCGILRDFWVKSNARLILVIHKRVLSSHRFVQQTVAVTWIALLMWACEKATVSGFWISELSSSCWNILKYGLWAHSDLLNNCLRKTRALEQSCDKN